MSRLTRHLVFCGAIVGFLLVGQVFQVQAQDIEPRAFSNAPIGVNY
ncbi:hypothetical protein [Thiocapsa rosea]|nr:hypothetical protein [Thiocapsa rosea]